MMLGPEVVGSNCMQERNRWVTRVSRGAYEPILVIERMFRTGWVECFHWTWSCVDREVSIPVKFKARIMLAYGQVESRKHIPVKVSQNKCSIMWTSSCAEVISLLTIPDYLLFRAHKTNGAANIFHIFSRWLCEKMITEKSVCHKLRM